MTSYVPKNVDSLKFSAVVNSSLANALANESVWFLKGVAHVVGACLTIVHGQALITSNSLFAGW